MSAPQDQTSTRLKKCKLFFFFAQVDRRQARQGSVFEWTLDWHFWKALLWLLDEWVNLSSSSMALGIIVACLCSYCLSCGLFCHQCIDAKRFRSLNALWLVDCLPVNHRCQTFSPSSLVVNLAKCTPPDNSPFCECREAAYLTPETF